MYFHSVARIQEIYIKLPRAIDLLYKLLSIIKNVYFLSVYGKS